MEYDAITLDTNVFDRNGLRLESGLLAQMMQFKDGSAQFVLSEIVVREVHRHLVEMAKNTRDDLANVARKAIEHGLVLEEVGEQLTEIAASALQPRDAAKARLEAFLQGTGAEIVSAEATDIKALIKSYFTPSPPFEGSGKKKNEFPDAIALLSLEAWAKAVRKRVFAISQDKGWSDFAKGSEWIDVDDDLASALAKFQEHAEAASNFMAEFVSDLDAGMLPEMMEYVADRVSDEVSDVLVFPEASAAYYFEPEPVELTYEDLTFLKSDDGYDIDVVQIGKNRIVARVGLSVSVRALGSFSFEVKDIDNDYMPIGGCSAEAELDFDTAILITLEGDFSGEEEDGFDISEIELIQMIDTVDFGEVGPDYGEDYYDE